MKKDKVKCPLCNSRKPARTCISLNKDICSRCCGERRNEEECKGCNFLDNINLSKLRKEELNLRKKVERADSYADQILGSQEGKQMLALMSKMDPKLRDEEMAKIAKELPKESEMLFRITAEKDPSAHNILSYGYILYDLNQPRKAIEQFKRVISMDKNNLYAHTALAEAYEKIGELELTEKSYRNILDIEDDKAALWNYFRILSKEKKYNLIEEESKEILKKDRDNLIAAYFLMDCAVFKDDEEGSKLALLNFFSLEVTAPDEKKWFDTIIKEAKRHNIKLELTNEEEFTSRDELLESFRKEDINKALKEHNELFSLFPNVHFVNFSLGVLHELKSDFSKAVFHYNRALKNTKNLTRVAPALVLKNSIENIEKALNTAKSKIPDSKIY